MTDQPQPLLRKLWRNWLKPIIVVIVIVAPIRSSIADWNDVPTQSMEPTILVGDRILVNKLAYGLRVPFTHQYVISWSGPERGDIVVFHAPGTGKRTVKRVIALPGDRVALRNNRLFINGKAMPIERRTAAELEADDLTDPAPYLFGLETLDTVEHAVMVQPLKPAQRDFAEMTVPDGQYFLMGDNRDNSGDSRFFGFVPRKQILGEAFGTAFSLDHDKWYSPRWDRFLRDLD